MTLTRKRTATAPKIFHDLLTKGIPQSEMYAAFGVRIPVLIRDVPHIELSWDDWRDTGPRRARQAVALFDAIPNVGKLLQKWRNSSTELS